MPRRAPPPRPARRRPAPALPLLGALAGCATSSALHPMAHEEGLLPGLRAEPAALQLPAADWGRVAQGAVTIINDGELTLPISGLEVSGGFQLAPPPVAALGPGESVELQISREVDGPAAAGALRVEAPGGGLWVPLAAEGRMPGLAFDPPQVFAGEVLTGCPAQLTVELWNPGGAPTTVTALRPIGEGLELEPLDLPLTLPPGARAALGATFHAPAGPPAGRSPPLSVQAEADGPAPAAAAQIAVELRPRPRGAMTWRQDGPWPEVDLVLVVDRSASMDEERARLADGVADLVESFDELGVDWRVGVLTRDDGCLNGAVDPADADPVGALLELMDGAWGLDAEAGLQRAARAAAAADGGCTAGFFRPEARAAFLFLSDEPDQSARPWAELVAELRAFDPDVALSAIVGPPEGCEGARPGRGYLEAAAATGGATLSICSGDWRPWLLGEGARLGGEPTGRFPLRAPVGPGPVDVRVDGEPAVGWRLEPDALVFDAGRWPGPGAQIALHHPLALPCDG